MVQYDVLIKLQYGEVVVLINPYAADPGNY